VGVHPYKSVEKLQTIYLPLTALLSKKLNKKVSLNIAKDYKTHIDLAGQDKIDIAYLGPASYVALVEKYGKKRLLARQLDSGKPTFTGNIIVRTDSDIHEISDLENKRIAFGDRESTMSHLVPRYMMIENGITKDKLREISFLGSHDNVAIAVLSGEYEAGAVKEAVFHKYKSRGLRSLATTPELSEHLFVASNKLPEKTVIKIRNILLNLGDNKEGMQVLKGIKSSLTGMGTVEDKDYDNLRMILNTLKKKKIIND
jgi:phosphonate transport system substrate-binding protein